MALAPQPVTPLADRIKSLESKLNADELPLDRRIYNTYLDPFSGIGYLITTERGDLLAPQLEADMTRLKLIETWSDPVKKFGVRNAE